MCATQSVLILGTSRFSEEVAEWVVETPGMTLVGFVENLRPERCQDRLLDLPLHWVDSLASVGEDRYLLSGLGTTGRRRYIEQVGAYGLPFATLVHPAAHLAPSVNLGAGCLIGPGALLATRVSLGEHVLVNKGAIIGHHSEIGRYSTIGLGARLAGGCLVEEGVYVAMGAMVLENIRIGTGALISAGALVTRDVPPHTQVTGMPARILRRDVDGH